MAGILGYIAGGMAEAVGTDMVTKAKERRDAALRKLELDDQRSFATSERVAAQEYDTARDELKYKRDVELAGVKKDDAAIRAENAKKFGLTPDDPAYQGYVLTGKMPREDQAPLTATDKKAILEADEMVQANEYAVDMLDSVLAEPDGPGSSLNDKAGSGALAQTQSWLARNDPTGIFDDETGQATTNLDNVVIGQALASLKSTFGAAPTEGERKILVDLQASVDKTPAERKAIITRAKEAAQRRLQFNRKRADELRGGTFYKRPDAPSGGYKVLGVEEPQ